MTSLCFSVNYFLGKIKQTKQLKAQLELLANDIYIKNQMSLIDLCGGALYLYVLYLVYAHNTQR